MAAASGRAREGERGKRRGEGGEVGYDEANALTDSAIARLPNRRSLDYPVFTTAE